MELQLQIELPHPEQCSANDETMPGSGLSNSELEEFYQIYQAADSAILHLATLNEQVGLLQQRLTESTKLVQNDITLASKFKLEHVEQCHRYMTKLNDLIVESKQASSVISLFVKQVELCALQPEMAGAMLKNAAECKRLYLRVVQLCEKHSAFVVDYLEKINDVIVANALAGLASGSESLSRLSEKVRTCETAAKKIDLTQTLLANIVSSTREWDKAYLTRLKIIIEHTTATIKQRLSNQPQVKTLLTLVNSLNLKLNNHLATLEQLNMKAKQLQESTRAGQLSNSTLALQLDQEVTTIGFNCKQFYIAVAKLREKVHNALAY